MKPRTRAAANILAAASVAWFTALAAPAGGEPIAFDGSWEPFGFPHLADNEFELSGDSLNIRSDDSVSFVFKLLPRRLWKAKTARWKWTVDQSVPPTDLSQRGGDDRNIMIYFLFMPEQTIRSMNAVTPRRVLMNQDSKILSVAWGGDHPRGAVIDNPFADGRGKIIALRRSGAGAYYETFRIDRGYSAAFGGAPEMLVAVAVGSDSDDTDSAVRARITGLKME